MRAEALDGVALLEVVVVLESHAAFLANRHFLHLVLEAPIAATALVHGMTAVTRNVADFKQTGAAPLDQWDNAGQRL